ncbi:MAG: hypothetical protein JW784_07290, partial [Candidatus Cloacimonetes bacterium]|nr:hypothetical protein [Candidatus Cloacimonadota bacterium]
MKKYSVIIIMMMISSMISARRIAILPLSSLGIDSVTVRTADLLLYQEFGKQNETEVISRQQVQEAVGNTVCLEVECAVNIGKKTGAEEVISCSLNRLGRSIIVQYMSVDVNTESILIADNVTSVTVEDLESVMKRVCLSIMRRKPIDNTAEVGAIISDDNKSVRRRQAHPYAGFTFGYLYPQEGYDGKDRVFTVDFRSGFEMEKVAVGAQLAIRKGFAANISVSYLLTKTDLCPYVGGAFGFHWVNHNDDDNGKKS